MAEIDDILNTLIAEAYGEGDEGMRRVGETILNRSAIRGIDPVQVVRQPHQYAGYSAPGPAAVRAQNDPIARSAAEAAWNLARQPGDPTGGADHYFNPNIVNPGWRNSMQHTGDYGDHTYYSSRQVPADALAHLLVPENRNVPSPRPRPASPMDQIAQMFAGSFNGAGNRSQTAAGLDEYINRPRAQAIAPNDMVFGTGFNDSFQRAGASTKQTSINDLAAALEQMMPERVASSSPSDPVGDGPSRSFFEDMFNTSLSGVGQSPSTRTVQSVPVRRQSAPPQMTGAQARADNNQTRSAPTPSRLDGTGAMPAFGDLAMMFGTTPQPSGSINNQKSQSRLEPSTKVIDRSNTPVAAGLGGKQLPVDNEDWTVALPRERPGGTPNSRVAVTPYTPPRSAPAQMTWGQARADNGQNRAPRKTTGVTMPTAASQRPAQARAAAMAAPVRQAAQPLRVVVKAEPPKINPANHNIEQLRAALSGRSSYTPSGGGQSMPVFAVNGKLRNSYGDSGSTGSGGSLL